MPDLMADLGGYTPQQVDRQSLFQEINDRRGFWNRFQGDIPLMMQALGTRGLMTPKYAATNRNPANYRGLVDLMGPTKADAGMAQEMMANPSSVGPFKQALGSIEGGNPRYHGDNFLTSDSKGFNDWAMSSNGLVESHFPIGKNIRVARNPTEGLGNVDPGDRPVNQRGAALSPSEQAYLNQLLAQRARNSFWVAD